MKHVLTILAFVSACAFAANPVTLSPGESVTITAQQGGIVVTPTPAPAPVQPTANDCGVSGMVLPRDMDWFNPTRLHQPMGADDAIVVRFTTGLVASTTSLPRIAAAEWNSPPSSRIATLSAKPCDFGPQPTIGAGGEGNSVTMVFAIDGNGYGYYPVLHVNSTYYLNIKNSPNSSCRGGSCEMFIDLIKAGGL